jgi:hypothetical protein
VRPRLALIPFLLALSLAAACGNQIGDECSINSECSPNGDRICDTTSPGGYCTVFGCDFDTCPEDSVCVRFFSVGETNIACNAETEDVSTDDCTPQELCTLAGSCVPRSAESRWCMRTCDDSGDCRDKYECRDQELMRLHGGEPVLAPGESMSSPQSFCAASPTVN